MEIITDTFQAYLRFPHKGGRSRGQMRLVPLLTPLTLQRAKPRVLLHWCRLPSLSNGSAVKGETEEGRRPPQAQFPKAHGEWSLFRRPPLTPGLGLQRAECLPMGTGPLFSESLEKGLRRDSTLDVPRRRRDLSRRKTPTSDHRNAIS